MFFKVCKRAIIRHRNVTYVNCLTLRLYQLDLQSTTQEASGNDDPTTEDLGDVSKNDTAKAFSNKTPVEVQQIKEDLSSLQNGVDKQREDATRNLTESQKTPNKKHQTKKSNFGGLKKGFFL